MPIATADQLRNRPIHVAVPGTDLDIVCRCPDPLTLIADGLLPLELFAGVLASITETSPSVIVDNRPLTIAKPGAETYFDFVDRWACAAAVTPRIVRSEGDANAEAIWVEDLDVDVKLEILRRTNRRLLSGRVTDAVREFRSRASAGVDAGPDGAPVRDTAVAAVASA